MFRTLFTNGLDLERLSRVWDCWVFEGDRVIIRAAAAILGSLENQLLGIVPGNTGQASVVGILGWGPKDVGMVRAKGGSQSSSVGAGEHNDLGRYWNLDAAGDEDAFMEMVKEMGRKP